MRNRSIIFRRGFLALIPLIFVLPSFGQNPVASRGEQLLSITQEECSERGRQALIAEGYTFLTSTRIWGGKTIHTAGILCNAAPNGKMWVNIIVASTHSDPNVPGAERVKLQGRMEQSASGPAVIQASWGTNATQYRGQNIRVTINCPAGGSAGRVWGTDYYTDDSSICTAGVHMGLITFANGGRVTIEVRQGSQSYTGTARYGVNSSNYGAWGGSYVFVR